MLRKSIAVCCLLFTSFVTYAQNSVKVTIEYKEGIPASILVSGVVDKNEWLGVSLYPATVTDATKEGHHITREIKKGNFIEAFAIDNKLASQYGSSYEIALWGKKVEKKDCTIQDCYWCQQRGYHLEDATFYQTGYFNTIKNTETKSK
ncbi:MAG: hypothetical protein WC614_06720 [bacterium]